MFVLWTTWLGCDGSGTAETKKRTPAEIAKIDFDYTMERLQQALDTSGSAAHLNLRVKHELKYELVPPDTTRSNFTARVTIKSRSDYIPEKPYAPAEEKAKQENPSELIEDSLKSSDNLDFETRQQKPLVATPPAKLPSVEEVKEFEMAYLDGRWKLQTEPDSELEQMWFDYALQN